MSGNQDTNPKLDPTCPRSRRPLVSVPERGSLAYLDGCGVQYALQKSHPLPAKSRLAGVGFKCREAACSLDLGLSLEPGTRQDIPLKKKKANSVVVTRQVFFPFHPSLKLAICPYTEQVSAQSHCHNNHDHNHILSTHPSYVSVCPMYTQNLGRRAPLYTHAS